MVYGLGETVLDIIFPYSCGAIPQPRSAVPGGSVFNSIISLGRAGIPCAMLAQVGDDRVGELTRSYLRDNGVSDEFVSVVPGMKSHISLAFLDEASDAHYTFYKDHSAWTLTDVPVSFTSSDILLIGSFYAVNPVTRPLVQSLLLRAKAAGATIYYDINYRKPHLADLPQVMPALLENIRYADVVKASQEDLDIIGLSIEDLQTSASSSTEPSAKTFILTRGAEPLLEYTHMGVCEYPVPAITPLSTVGAGDNFNAGYIYAFARGIVGSERIALAQRFAQDVCLQYGNSISDVLVSSLVHNS